MIDHHRESTARSPALLPSKGRRDARAGGFSLIEIAIGMAIMGTLFVGGLNLMAGLRATDQAKVTATRLDLIEQALVLFARRNGRLPCPANGSIADDGTIDGKPVPEGAPNRGQADPAGAADICNSMAAGIVPWIDLGLPAETALDGWKRRFSYHVFDGAAGLTRAKGVDGSDQTGKGLEIRDEFGLRVADPKGNDGPDGPDGKTGAAYVLISHGLDGWGAYLPSGKQIPPSGPPVIPPQPPAVIHPLEIDNTDGNPFRTAPSTTIDDATHFDDIVRWTTIDKLANNAGFIKPGK